MCIKGQHLIFGTCCSLLSQFWPDGAPSLGLPLATIFAYPSCGSRAICDSELKVPSLGKASVAEISMYWGNLAGKQEN